MTVIAWMVLGCAPEGDDSDGTEAVPAADTGEVADTAAPPANDTAESPDTGSGAIDTGPFPLLSGTIDASLAASTLLGRVDYGTFPDRVMAPGDLDGDGLADLIIEAFDGNASLTFLHSVTGIHPVRRTSPSIPRCPRCRGSRTR